jgi:cyclophilin family peptidyl-prolyl cis-trans isomerase
MLNLHTMSPDAAGSQFFLTFTATPWLDGKHMVFGEVSAPQRRTCGSCMFTVNSRRRRAAFASSVTRDSRTAAQQWHARWSGVCCGPALYAASREALVVSAARTCPSMTSLVLSAQRGDCAWRSTSQAALRLLVPAACARVHLCNARPGGRGAVLRCMRRHRCCGRKPLVRPQLPPLHFNSCNRCNRCNRRRNCRNCRQVLEGMDIVKKMETKGTQSGRPTAAVKISDSGVIDMDGK